MSPEALISTGTSSALRKMRHISTRRALRGVATSPPTETPTAPSKEGAPTRGHDLTLNMKVHTTRDAELRTMLDILKPRWWYYHLQEGWWHHRLQEGRWAPPSQKSRTKLASTVLTAHTQREQMLLAQRSRDLHLDGGSSRATLLP